MHKYIIYARKSSESEDRQALSIDSQINELNKISRNKNYQIVDILTESKSAKAPGRPLFNRVIERLKSGEADSLLVWNPDRLSRNSVDSGLLIYLFDTNILQEIATPYQSFHNTPNDKFLLQILWGQAKLENDNKSINVKRGMEAKVNLGWYPYQAIVGYLNTPDKPKGYKIIIKDPNRFQLVRKMWELLLTGAYNIPILLKIVNYDWGFRTIQGKPLSRSGMYNMFSNIFYTGNFMYGEKLYKGKHEAMVTLEEYKKAQQIIHRKNVKRPQKHDLPYTDLLKCGECGFSITGTIKEKYYKRTNHLADYVYYHCTHKNKKSKCIQKPITNNSLEDQFIKILELTEIEPEFNEWAIQYYRELDEYEKQSNGINTTNIQNRCKEIEIQIDELLNLRLSNAITTEEYEKKKQELYIEKNQYQKRLQEDNWIDKANEKYSKAVSIREKFRKKSPNERKEILLSIGSNYLLKDRKVSPQLDEPYFIFKKAKEDPKSYLERFELPKDIVLSPQTIKLAVLNPTWLRLVNYVGTYFKVQFGKLTTTILPQTNLAFEVRSS